MTLYQGKFLSGHYLPGCPDYEIWLVREQKYWEQQTIAALSKLINYHQKQPVSVQAIALARQWLHLDPLHEAAIRHLMLLLTKNGQPETALQQYRLYRHNLLQELDMTPSAELSHLYQQIKDEPQTFLPDQPGSATATLPSSPYRGLATFTEADAPFFFGRDTYIAPLIEAVTRHPLTVIIGPSGSGKSSLVFGRAAAQPQTLPRCRLAYHHHQAGKHPVPRSGCGPPGPTTPGTE